MNDAVLLDVRGPVAALTLNRPDALNVLDATMADALVEHTGAIAADDSVRVVVLRGRGKHFMAGGDIRVFSQATSRPSDERRAHFQQLVERIHTAIDTIARMPQPVIAGVQGAVAGFGLSLMNACDLVVATEDAYFASAYRQIGLTPDGGGSWSLPRLVGWRRAMEIHLLSERFDAARALSLGLVNRVVPGAELDAAVDAYAQSIAQGPKRALRQLKRLMRESLDASLPAQLQAEAVSFGQCAGDDDFVEGIGAFLAKRPAAFRKD